MKGRLLQKLIVVMLTVMLVFTGVPVSFAAEAAVPETEPAVAEVTPEAQPTVEATANQAQAKAKTKLAITKQPTAVKVIGGKMAVTSVKAKGDGLTYSWYFKNKGKQKFTLGKIKGAKYSVKMNGNTNGRQVYCVVKDRYGNKVKSKTVTLSMKKTITITKQPKTVTFKKGSMAKVSVAAKGQGLTYSWYYKNKGKKKWNIGKIKGPNYSVKMNGNVAGRKVYCVIKDKYGYKIKTNTVTLHQGTTFKVTKQPNGVTVKNGNMAKTTVKATGDGLTYKWYFKNKGASKFTLAQKQKSKTYSVKMNANMNGRQVYCVIKDKYGSKIKTKTVTLKMQQPIKITKQPTAAYAADGKTVKTTVTATGKGLTYKWYFKNKGASKFTLAKKQTTKTYSVKMTSKINGRQVYCQITDTYGKKLKTKTVTLSMKQPLKITKQPESVTVDNGVTAKISVAATGQGLKYKWYYKNPSATKFVLDKNFTGKSYSVKMSDSVDGRQVYCVITDKFGESINTKTVTVGIKHSWDKGKVTKKATCTVQGEKTYTCTVCKKTRIEYTAVATHNMGEWTLLEAATVNEDGLYRRACKNEGCDYFEYRNEDKLPAVYTITAHTTDKASYKVGVAKDGKYNLANPTRKGYVFKGWKDSNGKSFNKSGTINKNIDIYAVWEVRGTDTVAKLVNLTANGVEEIKITADIEINQPVYIADKIKIYADGDYVLKRADNYSGDLFVVGQNKNGKTAIENGKEATLTLGGGKGELTIDGNSKAMKTDVEGSALFVADSSTLNIYDGVKIINHKKVSNKRVFDHVAYWKEDTLERAGGAAILNLNSEVNLYGGVINNNEVVREYTTTTDASGAKVKKETAGCGGAIYNGGTFNMYGGTISNSKGLRGGAIYNNRFAHMYAGIVSDNTATVFGGAVASSSSGTSDLYVGKKSNDAKIVFSNNHAMNQGGALYSNTSSPIVVYGNAEFVDNHADSSGGAIHTAGALTVSNADFSGNYSTTSGGAIYHLYTKATMKPRNFKLSGSSFNDNYASLGGAIILSASSDVASQPDGTNATIDNCKFENNKAVKTEAYPGAGGAIYITRKSTATVSGCEFSGNSAVQNAGAIAALSEAKLYLSNSEFANNQANGGGGLYASQSGQIELTDVTFSANKAVLNEAGTGGNGGAISSNESKIAYDNVDFHNNSAAGNAGAVYQKANSLEFDSTCEFVGNTAKAHGGAVYLTYKTLNDAGDKDGAKLTANGVVFKDNEAGAGGAVSVRTACEATITGGEFKNNEATNSAIEGGGAVFVGFGKLAMADVVAKGNSSAASGGAISLHEATAELQNVELRENSAANGGAVNSYVSDVTYNNVDFYGNKATNNAGAINQTTGTLTLDESCAFDGNTAGNHGGAIHLTYRTNSEGEKVGSVLQATGVTFENGSAAAGGAVSVRSYSEANLTDVSLLNNTATGTTAELGGGAVYVGYSKANLTNVTATGNTSAGYGGTVHYLAAEGAVSETAFESNTAKNGGAMSLYQDANVTFDNADFLTNKATEHGGALYLSATKLDVDSTCEFTGNTAEKHGGAVYLTHKDNVGSVLNAKEVTFKDGSAAAGGAISVRSNSKANLTDVTLLNNDATSTNKGEGGGAVFAGFGEVAMTGAIVKENTSAGDGGAINLYEATATLKDVELRDNNATDGGAVNSYVSDVTYDNVDFYGNKATNNAGAINQTTGMLTLDESCAFEGNTAGNHGGAIHLTYRTNEAGEKEGSVLKATGVTFENGSAAAGGAVSVRSYSEANLTNVNLLNNKATGTGAELGGGAVYVGYSKANLTNVTATGNTSAGYGGTVHYLAAEGAVSKTAFENNTAKDGGAMSLYQDANVTFDDVDFLTNKATEHGGALYLSATELNVDKTCTFDGNTAASHGGAVYLTHKNNVGAVLNATGVTFENGSAKAGGAISSRTNCSVTLTDTTLTGNKASATDTKDGGGGAIFTNNNTLVLSGVTITGNTSGFYGGGVFAQGADVTVNNTENNVSVISENYGKTGPALYFREGSNATLNNTSITNHVTEGGNGTVYITGAGTLNMKGVTATGNQNTKGGVLYASSGATVNVDQASQFSGNTAKESGGAIFATSNAKVSISGNSVLNGNTAPKAGAIYQDAGAKVTVDASTLEANAATTGAGGAISVADTSEGKSAGTTLTLKDAVFTGNMAATNGGAITNSGGDINATGEGTIFSDNTAINHGGAVYITYTGDNAGVINMTDGQITDSEAGVGGAISVRSNCTAELTNVSLKNNKATKADGAGGGAIYEGYGTVSLNNVTVSNNTSEINGGAIAAAGGKLTINGGTFGENSAVSGGAIATSEKCDFSMNNATVTNNKATQAYDKDVKGGGGAIFAKGNTAVLSGVIMDNNESVYYGGTIFATGANVTINADSEIKNSIATTGSAICGMGATTLNIEQSGIKDNNAITTGSGVVYVTNTSVLNMTGATVTGNKQNNGGVVYSSGSAAVNIKDSTLTGNAAVGNGGAISHRSSGTTTIEGSTISGNTAVNGGAIELNQGTVTVKASTIESNTATELGGAIYATGTGNVIVSDGTVVKGNTAPEGGAIYEDAGTKVTVTASTLEANKATTGVGGAVSVVDKSAGRVAGTTLILENAVFRDNSAETNGGAITTSGATVTVTGADTLFSGNTAENQGGAVYVTYATGEDDNRNGGVLTMTDGQFKSNTAVAGGAISSKTGCTTELKGTILTGNKASATDTKDGGGGAISTNHNTLILSGVTITDNTSGFYGGGVYVQAADVTVNNNSAIRANHGKTGPALYFREGGSAILDGISIADHVTEGGNGTVYITGEGTLNMKGVTATGNTNTNGGVLYSSGNGAVNIQSSDFSGNTAIENGGVIDYRATGTMTITDTVMSNNSAQNGAAIRATKGIINIVDSEFESNVASKYGGAINATEATAVTISESSLLKGNSASNGGGAINIDKGAVVNVDNSTLEANTTNGSGGAVFITDTGDKTAATKLALNKTTLKDNVANNKGGAVATIDTECHNLTIDANESVFIGNSSSTAGGGAVILQNKFASAYTPTEVKMVFKNCTFTDNTSKTSGGALEIRNGSYAKIDGITATGNTATTNGGVVYVTSNHSKLYLTGTVEATNNTAESGAFANLYNSDYSNPPRIYTTHSNTASWVSGLAGNTTSVTYDLTTLP